VSGNLLQATDPVGLDDPDAGVPQVRDAALPGGAADTDSYGCAASRSFDEASAPPNAVPPEVSAAIQMWYNATRPPQSYQQLAHSQQKADRIALGAAIGAADQVTLGHFTEALRQVDRAHFRAVWSDPDVALGYLSGVLGTTLAEAWGAAELVVGGGAIAATPDGPPQLLGGAMVVAGVGVAAHAAAGVMANAHNISHAASTVVLAENWGGEGDAPTHQTRGSTAAGGAPNPHGSRGGPAHRGAIERRIDELRAEGHEHVGGGSLPEEVIPTPGGCKTCRRPDITTRAPDGSTYRENVGRSTRSGDPIGRERRALDDIEAATGTRPGYTPYDR